MARIAYYRVSTSTQSIEAQRSAMPGPFDKEFRDEGVGGHVLSRDRTGFAEMMAYVREADTLYVYAIHARYCPVYVGERGGVELLALCTANEATLTTCPIHSDEARDDGTTCFRSR